MFGFAVDQTPELMPLPIALSHRLMRKVAELRKSGQLAYLRPDAKAQVTVEYDENEQPVRVDTVVISTQHDADVTLETIQKDMLESARVRRDERIVDADTLEELLKGVDGGNFVKAGWCGCRECEDEVKAKTAATARVCDSENTHAKCVVCGKPSKHTVIFARAY